ncbi:MAG: GNAT family N-acetyltransferase [Chloroflexi bacterium]|nr:GNAT family N-acetyltransferase [Chloroflexota bacterium]
MSDVPLLPERIETARLVLRRWTLADAEDVLAYAADPEWSRFLPVPEPYERRHAEEAVARWVLEDWSTHPDWAMEIAGRASGGINLRLDHQHRHGELGYALARRHWGNGYMTEAVRAVIDAAFATLPDLARVQAGANARNRASIRVMERLGMTHEGTIPHAPSGAKLERREAGVIYAVLRDEWEPLG